MNARNEINILVKQSQDRSSIERRQWKGIFRAGKPLDPNTPQWVIDDYNEHEDKVREMEAKAQEMRAGVNGFGAPESAPEESAPRTHPRIAPRSAPTGAPRPDTSNLWQHTGVGIDAGTSVVGRNQHESLGAPEFNNWSQPPASNTTTNVTTSTRGGSQQNGSMYGQNQTPNATQVQPYSGGTTQVQAPQPPVAGGMFNRTSASTQPQNPPPQVGGLVNWDAANRVSTKPAPAVGGLVNWDAANRVSTKTAPAVGGLLRTGATASPPKKTPQVGGFLKSRRTAAPNQPQVGGFLKHSEANAKEEINALVKRAGIVQDAVVGTLTPLYAWQNRRWRKAHGLPEVPFSGATKYNSVLGAAQSAVNASGVPVGKPYRPSVWHGGKQVTK